MKTEKIFYLFPILLFFSISLLLGGRQISQGFLLVGLVLSVIAFVRKISLNIYAGVFLLVVSVVLTIIEFVTYDNYLFSHFGLITNKLWLITASLFSLSLAGKINLSKNVDRLFYYFIICLSVFYFQPAAASSVSNFKYLVTNSHDQLIEEYGQIINFIGFLSETLPKNSTLLIPPETLPWRYSGNSQLMGAWLYPVKVYTVSDPKFDSLKNFDYLLISSEDSGKPGRTWPDFNVHTEDITVFNWTDSTGTRIYGDYDPAVWYGWGLIKVRKNNY